MQTREGNVSFIFGLRESPQSTKSSSKSYITVVVVVVLNVGGCWCFLQTNIGVNTTTDINGTTQGSTRDLSQTKRPLLQNTFTAVVSRLLKEHKKEKEMKEQVT